MKRFLSLLLLPLLVACSSTEPKPGNDPAPGARNDANGGSNAAAEPRKDPEPAPEPKPAIETRGKLEPVDAPEQLRAIGLIEKVTGRKFKTPVPVYVFSQEELEAEVKSWGDYAPENVLGFYKYATKAMYLVPEAAGNRRAFGLRLHEGVHALQDQLYDLASLHQAGDSDDASAAITALIEGQAVQVMIDALPENPHVGRIAEVKVPTDLNDEGAWQRVLYYAYGAVFVQDLKKRNGYEAVDAAFKALPQSTEQILHPSKYPAELPDTIQLPGSLPWPEGFAPGKASCAGEFRVLVELHRAGIADPATAAEGWGGDIEITARKGDAWITLRVTSWDSQNDAVEYLKASSALANLRASQRNDGDGQDGRIVRQVFAAGDITDEQIAELTKALQQATVRFHS